MDRLILGVALAAFAFGCAEERPVIDRVQPNGLSKSMFDGEWYYVRTVVDVPAANGFTHVGDTDHSGMKRITWDIQEDYLFARRTTELIEGADAKVEEGDDYEGEVVAAYPIVSHFDIARAYNSTTGEQINVREENTSDRPWYEREYIRVDWSQNMVHNYALSFEAATVESVPYYVQEIDPKTGERHPDAPYFEPDGSYFDITNKIFAKAGTFEYPGYGTIPVCWLYGNEFDECGAGEFTIRNSFKRIDPAHQYEALPYKGKATEVFGYFTTDRLVYDPEIGIRQQNKKRFLNRHNLWKRWRDDNGDIIPVAQRELRPLVYHVNRDMPDDLKPVVKAVGDQWNSAFTDAVKAMGFEPKGRVFIVCPNNPIEAGDAPECGPEGSSPRLGDIRYSFMAYVPKYMTYGLLGLGPSNNDPETGEIISGMAYVYHHNNLAAYRVQELVQLLNGDRDVNDYIDGVDLTDWRAQVNAGEGASSQTYGLDDAAHMVEQIVDGPAAQRWADPQYRFTPQDFQAIRENGFDAWVQPVLDEMFRMGYRNGERHSPEGTLGQLAGTYIEDLLINDELLMATGHDPRLPLDDNTLDRVSVARGGLGQTMKSRGRLREEFAAYQNKYLPEMADDALMGLARELKGKSGEEAYNTARNSIYTAVLAHEVGHSLGLMHNFGGSDDALNYFDAYWHIRDDGNVGPRLEGMDPITDEEIDAHLYDNAYSSIMDYAGRYTIDGQGIGKYDRAAIMFGYANKVEVYKDNGGVPHDWFTSWFDRDGDPMVESGFTLIAPHYTEYFKRMGASLYEASNRMLVDVDQLSGDFATASVDGNTYTRVPYIYCSHSRANLSDSCLTRDFGADAAERMKNILDELNTWYIERNFPRGSITSTHFNYVERWYGRIYDRLKKWHDIYGLLAEIFVRIDQNFARSFLTDARNGWGTKTWAVQNAFNYLMQTIMMPDVGGYGRRQNADGTWLWQKGQSGGTPLGITDARYYQTSWSRGGDEGSDGSRGCGYFWFECLHHIGYYLDKIMAIEALSDSETNFVARSSPEDLREWEISYYTTFGEQIDRISSALMSQNYAGVGPCLVDGKLKFPNFTGTLDDECAGNAIIDPFATFSVQLYWQVLGQARFFGNYNQSFRDESRVFVIGTGREPTLDKDRLITFTDPTSGMTYGAIRYADHIGSGHAVLDRALKILRNSSWCDSEEGTVDNTDDCNAGLPPVGRRAADPELLDHIELIKVMADLSPMMDFGNPYAP
ncbi:MAG: zinc-dependent metalloprotease [Myxococcales bacterium]|nr:zinc-dependent metalloprotease [Myxococcales bacterium]